MRKETVLAVALVGGVVAVLAGWFLLSSSSEEPVPAEPVAIEPVERVEPESFVEEDYLETDAEPEEARDVTRIIIDEPGNGQSDISEILSEKVLLDDEIVDKTGVVDP